MTASAGDPSAGPLQHPAALALAGCLALAVAIGIGRFVYTPILPFMTTGLGLGKPEAGLIASANFLGYLLGALAAAWRPVPGDARLWLVGALAASAATTGAMGLTEDLGAFLALRFANGALAALVMVLASSLTMDRLAAAGRAVWAAGIYAGVGVGIALSSLAVPFAALGDGDSQGPWLVCGALALALSVPVWILLGRRGQAKPAEAAGSAAAGARADGFTRFAAAYGLFGFGYVITATFISDMVRADPVLQPAENLVWFFVGLAAAPSVAFWGWAGQRWGNERAFAAACLVEAFGVLLSVLGGGIWMVLVAAALLGGTFMGLTALGLVNARRLSIGDPRRNLALITAAFGLGQMIGPALAGLLHDWTGSYLEPSLMAAAVLAAAAMLAAR